LNPKGFSYLPSLNDFGLIVRHCWRKIDRHVVNLGSTECGINRTYPTPQEYLGRAWNVIIFQFYDGSSRLSHITSYSDQIA